MTLARTFDAAMLNQIANDPQVRPSLLGSGVIDLTETVRNPANVALVNDVGGFVMVALGAGEYDVHTVLPIGTNSATEAALEALEYLFIRTDAVRLTTKVPYDNTRAAKLAKLVGFTELFRSDVFDWACLELTLDRWACDASDLECEGRAFHGKIVEACPSIVPPPNEIHDRIVGAAVWMASSGNAYKGLTLHNRWAGHAGYAHWQALSLQPPIFNTGDAIVEFWPEDMEVLPCQ